MNNSFKKRRKSYSPSLESPPSHFAIKWGDFEKTQCAGMYSFLKSQELVDVTLAVEGKYLEAHKIILSICSEYFHSLFATSPCTHPIIFLRGVSYKTMKDLLTFMYNGEVKVRQENLKEFIGIGNELQIKGLLTEKEDECVFINNNKRMKRQSFEEENERVETKSLESVNDLKKQFKEEHSYEIQESSLQPICNVEDVSMVDHSFDSGLMKFEEDHILEEESEAEYDFDEMESSPFISFSPEMKIKSTVNPFVLETFPNCTEDEFVEYFRIRPETFDIILNLVGCDIIERKRLSGKSQIHPEKQLMIALWFMATRETYSMVSERFQVGKATVVRTLERVTKALSKKFDELVRWPKISEIRQIADNFERNFKFPNIVGVLGSMQCKLKPTKQINDGISTTKDSPLIRLMAVCDDSNRFINCFCSTNHTLSDYDVLQESPLSKILESKEHFPDDNHHLVAGNTYPLSMHVMVPYVQNVDANQEIFNQNLSSARQTLKQTFNLLKSRFVRLTENLPLAKVENSAEFALATCIIHNICVDMNDLSILIGCFDDIDETSSIFLNSRDTESSNKRDKICNILINRDLNLSNF